MCLRKGSSLELEDELGVVGPDDSLLVSQLATLYLASRAAFLAQPSDHLVHARLGTLEPSCHCARLIVFDPPCDAQPVSVVLRHFGEVASLHLPEDLEVDRCHLHE